MATKLVLLLSSIVHRNFDLAASETIYPASLHLSIYLSIYL